MPSFKALCDSCKREFALSSIPWRCPCGAPINIVTDLSDVSSFESIIVKKEWSMWRYSALFPVKLKISLGEGLTPIVKRDINGIHVLFKLEYLNPTGSFKDRGASLLISYLKSVGIEEVIEDSSGNAGAAIAAYAVAAGLKCRIFVPEHAPQGKVTQIKSYGVSLVTVRGPRETVFQEAVKEATKRHAYYAGHLWNPIFIVGLKTIVYEVCEQEGPSPCSAVVVPVGSGGLLLGLFEGFRDLLKIDACDTLPRIYAVQVKGWAPVYEALKGVKTEREKYLLADGVAISHPPRLAQIVSAVKESGGDAVAVTNEEVIQALKELFKMGFFVEPTSAVAFAGLHKLTESGLIDPGEQVLIPLTGIGLKATEKIRQYVLGSG